MTKKHKSEEQLTEEELEEAHGERLPDREQMSLIKPQPYPHLPVEPPGEYAILPVPPETE